MAVSDFVNYNEVTRCNAARYRNSLGIGAARDQQGQVLGRSHTGGMAANEGTDMKTTAYIAIAGAMLLSACDRGPPTPEKTAQQLMAEDVQPTAEIYWDSVQYISDEQGEHDIFPKTDAEWKRTKDAATRLAELGELLKTPGYAEGRGEDWTTFANSLVEVSRLAEQAAEQRDTDKIFEVGGTIYNVCSACHQAYPATTGPEAEGAENPGGEAA